MAMQQVLLAMGGSFLFNATISANTLNYNLKTAAIAAGWDQAAPLSATVTINAGVSVGSSSTANPGFDTGLTFPAGSNLSLINNGSIVGRGGNGARTTGAGSNNASYPELAGDAGGLALKVQAAISITNNGTIGGGGGGGGGGGANNPAVSSGTAGGGGGGAGADPGYRNAGGPYGGGGPGNNVATLTTGAAGNSDSDGGTGGTGGNLGQAGGSGTSGNWHGGAAGGAAGAAINGNSNISWVTTGTRLGAIT